MLDKESFSQVDGRKFLFFGGLATVCVDALLYPLELVKTRVQVESSSRATVFDASMRVARDVLRREGIKGLYKGFFFFTLGGLPSQGAYFFGYNWARERLGEANAGLSPDKRLPLYALDMAAGFFADVVASPLWTPTEVISTRLQIQGPGVVSHSGAWDAARTIYTTEGLRGLFRGLTASIVVFGPASAVWWATYQACNRRLTTAWAGPPLAAGGGGDTHRVWVDGVSGFVAGSVSSILTNPLDVAKTRLQAQHGLLNDFQLENLPSAASPPTRGRPAARLRGSDPPPPAGTATVANPSSPPTSSSIATPAPSIPQRAFPLHTGAGVDRLAQARQLLEREKFRVWGEGGAAGMLVPTQASSPPFFTRIKAAAAAQAARHSHFASAAATASAAASSALFSAARAVGSSSSSGAAASAASSMPMVLFPPAGAPFRSNPTVLAAATASFLAEVAASERRVAQRALARGTATPHGGGGALHKPRAGIPLHSGMTSMLLHIIAKDGPGALIRGLLPRLLMQGPASAATFVCYEQVMRLSRKDPA